MTFPSLGHRRRDSKTLEAREGLSRIDEMLIAQEWGL